ncbi:hypothetical protein [Halorubrum halodurans]|jgi:hypothetical protein|uniref:Glycine zipper domain-containing protein n=1 Tax=Halorubrum halodurans TaxID=1383851 RepID=A0A256IJ51_9EURY|nr:hypothetical protein [Halorubrum halodurans]OYR56326.1 hypothetical protein DJ70_09820 [Halorubrum halodurans]
MGRIRTAISRAKYAAVGAALGAAIGGLANRNAASTGGALGGLAGATVGEMRVGECDLLGGLRSGDGPVPTDDDADASDSTA